MSTIKLVVVDDHQLFREGVISLLSKKEDLEVVGEAENANGLWEILDQKKVHIVLICLLYTSPSPRDRQKSRMPSSA